MSMFRGPFYMSELIHDRPNLPGPDWLSRNKADPNLFLLVNQCRCTTDQPEVAWRIVTAPALRPKLCTAGSVSRTASLPAATAC